MEKGYISIDTIEKELGDDTYKSYKEAVDNENALKDEFNTLNKMKQGGTTGEQVDSRLVESYNEKLRRRENFKADYSKFKDAKNQDAVKQTLENAEKSSIHSR